MNANGVNNGVLVILCYFLLPLKSFAFVSSTSRRHLTHAGGHTTLGISVSQLSISPIIEWTNDDAAFWMAHQELSEPSSSLLSSTTPAIGSAIIMLTIVFLLYLWEESVAWMRETLPKTLLPVAESILAEIGGLGFIGLILQSVLGNSAVKESLEGLSAVFFGEKDILVENFEFLHSAFFQVGVGFFIAVGAMTVLGIKKLNEIKTVQGLELDSETGACTVTPETLCKYIPVKQRIQNGATEETVSGGNNLWDELFMGKEERAARVLLLRVQIMKLFPHLPNTFRIETVVEASFAQNLYKLVEVSPLTWVYLIPALSLANAVDLSHEVINSASPNAADSVGYFFSTPSVILPSFLTVTLSFIWGFWNCWKMTQIKYMLIPRLSWNLATKQTEILPPLMESTASREYFDASPLWVQPVESVWAKPAKTPLEELFGTAGGAGMKLYQNSIKYQTWLCLTHIVFFGTQIIPRDLDALLTGTTVGDPSHLTAELVTYSGFVLVSMFQILLVSPRAFWNYCLVQVMDERIAKKLLVMSGNSPVPEEHSTIGSNNAVVL